MADIFRPRSMTLNVAPPTTEDSIDSLRFPLNPDHPMICALGPNGEDEIVGRSGDACWDFTALVGKLSRIYFTNDGKDRKHKLSDANMAVYRDILGYLWLSDRREITVSYLIFISKQLRAFLAECTRHNIVASELYKEQSTSKLIFTSMTAKAARAVIGLMAEVYANRHVLGFYILHPYMIREIERLLPQEVSEQTPYIPLRIWEYQALRLTEFLRDFIVSLDRFSRLFSYLVDCYDNAGYADARKKDRSVNVSPFNKSNKHGYIGSFHDLVVDYNVEDILKKWMVPSHRSLEKICAQSGPRILSTYFTAVCYVGLVYLANFSGMRSEELLSLAKKSIVIEEDKDFGRLFFLKGGTTKTVYDSDALWVTTPFSEEVIRVLSEISMMRITCASMFKRGVVAEDEHINPHLFMRAYEPWGLARGEALDLPVALTKPIRYGYWSSYAPNLFDASVLKITESDFVEAKKYTPTLNIEKYAVGKVWPLAMHQLRRTLIVNAVERGVSIFSAQYQAKHQSLVMTRTYASNHVGRRMSKQMTSEFMDAIYQSMVDRAVETKDDNFVSAYGVEHKSRLIEFVELSDTKKLLSDAAAGTFSIRETFYGLCFKKGHCPSGGISFVADCPGCAEGLGDKRKLPVMKRIRNQLQVQSTQAHRDSLLALSLSKQLEIIESAITSLEC